MEGESLCLIVDRDCHPISDSFNADVLAGGIWEAMVTTAAGLSVGIPAVILYNYYVNRVKLFVFQMESAGDEVIDILSRQDMEEESREDELEDETSPSKPVREIDPYDDSEKMKLADQSFDPEDLNFDGGMDS